VRRAEAHGCAVQVARISERSRRRVREDDGMRETSGSHTTNYRDAFIEVADDCPVTRAQEPPEGKSAPSVARRQFELIAGHPYELTSDDVIFTVHAERTGIPAGEREQARAQYFSVGRPCLRSSPLGKRYGWGVHVDAEGRVALVPVGTPEYDALAADDSLEHTRAMRSKRA